AIACQYGQVRGGRAGPQPSDDTPDAIAGVELDEVPAGGSQPSPAAVRCPRVDHDTAPDGGDGGVEPDDEAVTGAGHDRAFEAELCRRALTRLQLDPLRQDGTGQHLSGSEMEAKALPVLDRPRRAGECVDPGIDPARLAPDRIGDQQPAPLHLVPVDIRQGEGGPLAGASPLDILTVDL
ncbi:MAG: hypothetical protein GWN07_12435, partial [Actinobacteria bacterium]|nr:hypothetical protein [Actinomycetota bacterium]NIS31140.1 hypothetical protein [Actinomycetota bacterium]NIU66288.1 hypothetical protein [Actinomycetota bacterium]NIW28102.1 hypothetical protein [Actinomycetota bacterium]NIX20590.1 hypothetical protein [Actinomycetota bacterium]